MRLAVWILAASLVLTACAGAEDLQAASQSYQQRRDYASLKLLSAHLKKGMSLAQVESLLGPADYSPSEGIYYYSSDKREFVKEFGRDTTVGAVLEFRNSNGTVTHRLESWTLMPIAE
jgi:hypothetical protein